MKQIAVYRKRQINELTVNYWEDGSDVFQWFFVKFSEAFDETVHRFDLKAAEVAERSGLTAAQISQFRNGRNIRTDNLERILNALPVEARHYMLMLVEQDSSSESVPLPTKNFPTDLEADGE